MSASLSSSTRWEALRNEGRFSDPPEPDISVRDDMKNGMKIMIPRGAGPLHWCRSTSCEHASRNWALSRTIFQRRGFRGVSLQNRCRGIMTRERRLSFVVIFSNWGSRHNSRLGCRPPNDKSPNAKTWRSSRPSGPNTQSANLKTADKVFGKISGAWPV